MSKAPASAIPPMDLFLSITFSSQLITVLAQLKFEVSPPVLGLGTQRLESFEVVCVDV